MDGVTVDVSELNLLAVDLTGVPDRVGARAAVVLRRAAVQVEAEAKVFAPVDTGNLRNSISVAELLTEIDRDTYEIEIGPTANYGAFVEFGTSRMGPHAFMGPAFDRAQPGFLQAMEQVAEGLL